MAYEQRASRLVSFSLILSLSLSQSQHLVLIIGMFRASTGSLMLLLLQSLLWRVIKQFESP